MTHKFKKLRADFVEIFHVILISNIFAKVLNNTLKTKHTSLSDDMFITNQICSNTIFYEGYIDETDLVRNLPILPPQTLSNRI